MILKNGDKLINNIKMKKKDKIWLTVTFIAMLLIMIGVWLTSWKWYLKIIIDIFTLGIVFIHCLYFIDKYIDEANDDIDY